MYEKDYCEKVYLEGYEFYDMKDFLQTDSDYAHLTWKDVDYIADHAEETMKSLLESELPEGAMYLAEDYSIIRRITDDADFEAEVDARLKELEETHGTWSSFGYSPWSYCFGDGYIRWADWKYLNG